MALRPGTGASLAGVNYGGLIREDVMNKIWEIDNIPLPFTNLIGSDTIKNALYEWTTDELADPTIGGWVVDGADSDKTDNKTGARLGNQAGILTKEVRVTERAQAEDAIGRFERALLSGFAATERAPAGCRGQRLGIQASLRTMATRRPVSWRASGHGDGLRQRLGFTPGAYTGGGIWSAFVPGTAQALTFARREGALSAAYTDNSDPAYLMRVPGVIEKLSAYMFTNNESIATLSRETAGMQKGGAAKAVSAVNVLISNFGQTVTFVPNRIQRTYEDATAVTPIQAAGVFLLDPMYHRLSMLKGYRVEPLAKTGLTDKRLMAVDWGQKVLNPKASGRIPDIDPTPAVTA